MSDEITTKGWRSGGQKGGFYENGAWRSESVHRVAFHMTNGRRCVIVMKIAVF